MGIRFSVSMHVQAIMVSKIAEHVFFVARRAKKISGMFFKGSSYMRFCQECSLVFVGFFPSLFCVVIYF